MRSCLSKLLLLTSALLIGACAAIIGEAPTPAVSVSAQQAVDELLAADRAFAEQAKGDLITALDAMFADDVVMPTPEGFATSRGAAIAALQSNPDNIGARAEWSPVRGGVSADGLHGLSFGYVTTIRADGVRVPGKYLTYWIKGADDWKAAVYRRGRRPEGEPTLLSMAPALPPKMRPESTDAATIEGHRVSLDQAERAFSDAAQKIGLGSAFVQYGSIDAINLGGPAAVSFVVGAHEIGRLVGEGQPATGSPVTWAPDQVLVASSGDLGVTIGVLVPNAPGEDGKPAANIPFFTIWRRPTLTEPWRYLAE
mgnify:CR=1 FL=1